MGFTEEFFLFPENGKQKTKTSKDIIWLHHGMMTSVSGLAGGRSISGGMAAATG
jgi:hypothetical protein